MPREMMPFDSDTSRVYYLHNRWRCYVGTLEDVSFVIMLRGTNVHEAPTSDATNAEKEKEAFFRVITTESGNDRRSLEGSPRPKVARRIARKKQSQDARGGRRPGAIKRKTPVTRYGRLLSPDIIINFA